MELAVTAEAIDDDTIRLRARGEIRRSAFGLDWEALSVRTVESHHAHVQQKTGRISRADLVRYALEHHLVEV